MKKLLTGILSTLALAVLMAVPAFAGTLVFDTAGGTFIAPSATYTKPEDPVRAGHTFTGWVDDDGKAITFNGSDVSGSKTAHATWKVSTYQIRFPSKVKLTGSDLTYGSTINTYTNTEGLSPLAKVSANAVISEFVNDRDPSVRISANQQQTNTVPEIGQQTGEKNYQQNISQQFEYPGNYTANVVYHVNYKEKVNVSITCPQYPTAIESVTGDMTAWPGEEIHLQVAYAIGYDNASYVKSSANDWSVTGNGKDFRNGLVDTISFKVPEDATGTVEIQSTVVAHIFRYTVRHCQEKVSPAGEYDLIEITNHEGFAGSYVGIENYGNTYENFTIQDEGQTLLDGDNKIIDCHYTRNQYAFTLGSCNGCATTGSTESGSYRHGSTITLRAYANNGYTWSMWKKGSSQYSTTANLTMSMPTENITMTPIVTPINYTITYDLAGGDALSNPRTSYNIESSAYTLPTPTRNGYKFTGWTGSNSSTPQTNVTIPAGSTESRSYTANWIDAFSLNCGKTTSTIDCGLSEHTHTDSCYTYITCRDPVHHDVYNQIKTKICGYNYEHTHSSSCYHKHTGSPHTGGGCYGKAN